MEQPKTALIDADSIIYSIGWANRENLEDADTVILGTDQFLQDLCQETNATRYLGAFTPSKTFRNRHYPEYKTNRPPPPDWILRWRPVIIEHCINNLGFTVAEDIEADDVLSIMRGDEMIYCSPDKDLKQIPGLHYNYNKKLFTEVTPEQANRTYWLSVLTGDGGDNIPGCIGIGPVKGNKILDKSTNWEKDILETYKYVHGVAGEELFNLYRSLLLLKEPNDEDRAYYGRFIKDIEHKDVLDDLYESLT